jgi:hypothetical protein
MSDAQVRAAIEQMESWLDDPAWVPDAESLTQWDQAFHGAVAKAEKGEGWPELSARAHEAGRRLDERGDALASELALLRTKLHAQDTGARALKGYGASAH